MPSFETLIQSGRFRLDYRVDGAVLSICVSGSIDEDANLGVLAQMLRERGGAIQFIQFDLGGVTRLNSCGVRDWVLLMEQLSQRHACAFLNVNERFVEQANMINNIFGPPRNPVLSFHAPYHCSQCNAEDTRLLDPTQVELKDGMPVAPAAVCNRCGAKMQFDSLEDEYFEFVRRMRSTDVDE